VTHPFHPLHGCEYDIVKRSCSWGEDRVYYEDESGRLVSIPADWTSAADGDLFVKVSAGRAWLHFDDLARLLTVVAELRGRDSGK
jgi:hypothetical protein